MFKQHFKTRIMKVRTLKQYAKKVGYPHYNKETTLEQIQDYFAGIDSLWDYPLEELEHVIENKIKCIIVKTDIGLRLCQVE